MAMFVLVLTLIIVNSDAIRFRFIIDTNRHLVRPDWTSEDMRQGTATVEEMERRKAWIIEHSKGRGENDINYLTSGRFVSPLNDVDLQTIERFYFNRGSGIWGRTFVLDRMHGRVYYNPQHRWSWLESMPYSAEFIDDDFNRLIQAIEESNLFTWQEYYVGLVDTLVLGWGTGWSMAIQFSDGTILRRGGSRFHSLGINDHLPPLDEFAVLTNFVETMGARVITRHNIAMTYMGSQIWVTEDMVRGIATMEEIEMQKAWTIEHSRNEGRYNLDYLIQGSFVSPANNIDLQTIERFVFSFGGGGTIRDWLVLDRMHGRVYQGVFRDTLDLTSSSHLFSGEFIEDDLNRLIQAIEESNLFDWQEYYPSPVDVETELLISYWSMAIQFADGSILRREGSIHPDSDLSRLSELIVLINFTSVMRSEIRERHNLEY